MPSAASIETAVHFVIHPTRVSVRQGREVCMKAATVVLAESSEYRPAEDEEFMNERQLEYFKQKLLKWKEDILRESRETLSHLQSETENHPDLADRASSETDRALELRTRDRQRKLISKIDEALRRIEDGSYGYCEETGSRSASPAWTPGRSPP